METSFGAPKYAFRMRKGRRQKGDRTIRLGMLQTQLKQGAFIHHAGILTNQTALDQLGQA